MATQTSNLGLTKPSYAETADIAVVNSNMDIIDRAANGLENGMAIVANGNTHAAITSGQFVYVRNHGTLSEGLYTANSNISANATLTTSNLSAVSGGGLNSLNEQIANLTKKTSYTSAFQIELTSGAESSTRYYVDRIGKTVFYDVVFNSKNALSANTTIATVTGLTNLNDFHVSAIGQSGTGARFIISAVGTIRCESAVPANEWFSFSGATISNNPV